MKNLLCLATLTLVLFCSAAAPSLGATPAANPLYIIKTNLGDITVELFAGQDVIIVEI